MRAGERRELFEGRVMLPQNRVRALEQFLTRLRQDHTARCPYEKLGSRLSLQLPDLHADGRLGDVDPGCPGRESATFRDRYECFQLSDVHNPEPCPASTWIITWIRSFSFHYSWGVPRIETLITSVDIERSDDDNAYNSGPTAAPAGSAAKTCGGC